MAETKIRTLIIDDSQQDILNLEKLLEGNGTIEIVGTISDPRTALPAVIQINPGLIFMDIQMPYKNGFEVTEEIYGNQLRPEVIFVTAFDKFAIQAIRYAAFDYLLKPVDPVELSNAVERLQKTNSKPDREGQVKLLVEKGVAQRKLKLDSTGGFTMIRPEDIIYIQADWNYSEIYFNAIDHEVVTTNIGALEDILPANEFFRISRSVILNLTYLKKVNRKKRLAVLVKDGKEYSFNIPLLKMRKLERFLES